MHTTRKYVAEIHQVAFTRVRVGGHSLAVETGCWNRWCQGRLPLEKRLYSCGAVQLELHVAESCPLIQPLGGEYYVRLWQQLMAKISYAII